MVNLKDIKKTKNTSKSDDISMQNLAFGDDITCVINTIADIKKLNEILTCLKNDMQEKHLSPKAQFNMITAAEEIFSNIALYAYNDTIGYVTIKTALDNNLYSITFSDNGKKYNPLNNEMPDVTIKMKDKDIGGLGVFLAKKLSDTQNYVYRNKQNILTISINKDKN